jgi:REP element-mobilizing transposase RayT
MPNTYCQIYIQIVFAVQNRMNFIKPEFKEELQKYMSGIITNRNQKLFAINCMPDHTHILVSMKPSISISDLTRDIKATSSGFINEKKWIKRIFNWQEGFGAFSYSPNHVDYVVKYILNQEEHHKKKTFKDEYLNFLKRANIEYNDGYLFEFYD